MAKTQYWIADLMGAHALVEGAEERDYWTQVQGWREVEEPTSDVTQVHVAHQGTGGRGMIPFAATKGEWAGAGWKVSAPPRPVDPTIDPSALFPADGTEEPTPREQQAAKHGQKSDKNDKEG